MVALQLLVLLVALHTTHGGWYDVKLNCTHPDWGDFCGYMEVGYGVNEEALNLTVEKKLRDTNNAIANLSQLEVKQKSDMLQPLLDVLKQEVNALTNLEEMINWVAQGICAVAGAVIAIAGESETVKKANETFTGLCSDWTERNRTFYELSKNLGTTLLSIPRTKPQN